MRIENIETYKIYSEKGFTKKDILKENKALAFTLNLKPGQDIHPHKHGESGLIIHVLTGVGVITIDDKSQEVKTGDVIYCEGQELFSLKNTSEENICCFAVLTK
jgi:quercetin dioxygenase-like cupin family protein